MTTAYKIGTIFYATKACEFYEVVAATPKTVTVRQLDYTRELGDGGSYYAPKLGQYIGEEKRRKVSQADVSVPYGLDNMLTIINIACEGQQDHSDLIYMIGGTTRVDILPD